MKRRAELGQWMPKAKKPRTLPPSTSLAVTREVKKQLVRKADKKFTDFDVVPTSSTYSGATYSLLTNLTRGDTGMDDFDGNQITPQSIEMRYKVTASSTADGFNLIRVIIGQSSLLGTPTPANLLQSINSSMAPLSARLGDRVGNYKILYDQTHALNFNSNFTEYRKVWIPSWKLNPVTYTSGTSPTVTKGDLFVLVISDDAVSPQPSVEFYSRVRYID